MSIYQTPDGSLIIELIALTDTSQTTIADGSRKAGMLVDSVQISNTTSGAITVQLHLADGTTNWQLEGGKSIPANGQALLDHVGFPMTENLTLKATGANGIQALVTYVRHTYRGETQAPIVPLTQGRLG